LISDGQGIATISDDDFALTIGSASVREGSPNKGKKTTEVQLTPITFTVNLSGPSATAVSVQYATQNGTAVAGSDFNAAAGTITFAPGETSKSIDVYVIADSLVEPNEGFSVVLTAPVGAELATAVGVGTIVDDDSKGGGKPPRISATRYTTAAKAPARRALAPKPVRDVFAWQGEADHHHNHDEQRGDDWHAPVQHETIAVGSFAASQSFDLPSAPATTRLATPRTAAGFSANALSLNDWRYLTETAAPVRADQSWLAVEWDAGDEVTSDGTGEFLTLAEADWLNALASDQAELSAV
jgi:hypothetical protein